MLLAAGGLLAAVLGATSASAQAPRRPLRITKPVNVTREDTDPSRTYSAPVLAVDPEDPMHVVAAGAEMRSRRCGLSRSLDGGQTWKQVETSPAAAGYPNCFITETGTPQAVVAFGRDHTLYYAYAGWDVQDTLGDWPIGTGGGWRGNVSVILSRSTDLGDTWKTTVARQARGKQGPAQENNRPVTGIAVDTTSGPRDHVYLAWLANYMDRRFPVVALSTDGGDTFDEPVNVTGTYLEDESVRATLARVANMRRTPEAKDLDLGFPSLTIDGRGNVFVLWTARANRGQPIDRSASLFSRSSDRGKTFTVTELSPAPNVWYFPALAWSPLGGAQGTIHVAYHHETSRQVAFETDVSYRRSTDGGATWSEATTINDDDPAQLYTQVSPNLTVAPNGRLDLAWWDFRHDDGSFSNDVYLVSSIDNGVTWSRNTRVTDRSIDRRIGPWYGNADIRQAPGLASTDELTVVAWDDTRNGDAVTHSQDVFTSVVQYETVGSGVSKAQQYALAAVLGVLAAGLLMVAAAAAARRQRPGGAVAPEEATVASAEVT